MRSVLVGILLAMATGCATVSMVPGEALVETTLTAEQSALRTASDQFCDTANDKGWAYHSNGMANLTALLMHGEGAVDKAGQSYAEQIGAETAAPSIVVQTIADDAETARLGLADVTAEAQAILAQPDIETARADVTSFERALVRAQKVHRNFVSALETIAARTAETAPADDALTAFEGDIDDARRIADDLAARYASIGEAAI